MTDIFTIIKKPLSTEKVVRLIDSQNTLCFIVKKGSTKALIKQAIEEYFKVKVAKVNTLITPKGERRAYLKLMKEHSAMDIATQLGLI